MPISQQPTARQYLDRASWAKVPVNSERCSQTSNLYPRRPGAIKHCPLAPTRPDSDTHLMAGPTSQGRERTDVVDIGGGVARASEATFFADVVRFGEDCINGELRLRSGGWSRTEGHDQSERSPMIELAGSFKRLAAGLGQEIGIGKTPIAAPTAFAAVVFGTATP